MHSFVAIGEDMRTSYTVSPAKKPFSLELLYTQ